MSPLSPSDCLVLARHVIGEDVMAAHPEADLLPDGSDVILDEKSGGGNPLFVRNIAIVSFESPLDSPLSIERVGGVNARGKIYESRVRETTVLRPGYPICSLRHVTAPRIQILSLRPLTSLPSPDPYLPFVARRICLAP